MHAHLRNSAGRPQRHRPFGTPAGPQPQVGPTGPPAVIPMALAATRSNRFARDRRDPLVEAAVVGWLVAVIVFAHGIGHSMGILQAVNLATINPEWHGDSWLLTGPLGATPARAIGVALWSVALLGFCAAAAAVVGWLPSAWFGPLAVVAAVASIVGVACFPVAFPTFSTLGALVIDVAVILAIVIWHWQPGSAPA